MANTEIRQETPTAFYIEVHDTDDVAIIVNDNDLKAGTRFPDKLELAEHIPQGHKVALLGIPANGEIIRYGEVIDHTVYVIPRGNWVDESTVVLPEASSLRALPLATKVSEPLPSLEGCTSEGYRNAGGSVGTENLSGITTSVHYMVGVVDYVVEIIERNLLPKYSNVDGMVRLNHLYGCGVAINTPAVVVPIRTIHNISLSLNSGGEVIVIGLSYEKLQPEYLLTRTGNVQAIPVEGASIVSLQDEKHVGLQSMVEDILQAAERHLQKLNQRQRETCPVSELVVGMQCGDSDAFSGVTANPAVGYMPDLLVRYGVTVMFLEVTEVRDMIHLLTPYVMNEEASKWLLEEMEWYDNYLDIGKTDRSASPSSSNKKGGLADVVEKAFGSIVKSGKNAIAEVLLSDQRSTKRGSTHAVTPASDSVCGTRQVTLGITVQVFTAGRGTPCGLIAVPVVKIAARTELASRWFDLVDINTDTIATGKGTIEKVGWKLFHFILDVASGKKEAFSDQRELHN